MMNRPCDMHVRTCSIVPCTVIADFGNIKWLPIPSLHLSLSLNPSLSLRWNSQCKINAPYSLKKREKSIIDLVTILKTFRDRPSVSYSLD